MQEADETKAKAAKVAPVKPTEPKPVRITSVHDDLVALMVRFREEYASIGVTRMDYAVKGGQVTVEIGESSFRLTVAT